MKRFSAAAASISRGAEQVEGAEWACAIHWGGGGGASSIFQIRDAGGMSFQRVETLGTDKA